MQRHGGAGSDTQPTISTTTNGGNRHGLQWLFHSRKRRKNRPWLVTFDWTEVRSFHALMAAAVIDGRGVPLLWASYEEWVLYKSQNNFEEDLLPSSTRS